MHQRARVSDLLHLEELEARWAQSALGLQAGADNPPEADGLTSAAATGSTAPVRLDLVALHELGHALGLPHSTDPRSIMYPYYNPNYDPTKLAQDPIIPQLRALYSNVATSPWKDALDPVPGNGKVDITFSFMPDGASMGDGTRNTLYATFDSLYGSTTAWKSILIAQLNRWASVSGGKLNFIGHVDTGLPFNYPGRTQNDPNAGDIRISARSLDGSGGTLAQTYFPPPNGWTAAGDSQLDQNENWDGHRTGSSTTLGSAGIKTRAAALTFAAAREVESNDLETAALGPNPPLGANAPTAQDSTMEPPSRLPLLVDGIVSSAPGQANAASRGPASSYERFFAGAADERAWFEWPVS